MIPLTELELPQEVGESVFFVDEHPGAPGEVYVFEVSLEEIVTAEDVDE